MTAAHSAWWGEHAGTREKASSRGLLAYLIRYDCEGLDDLFAAKRSKAAHGAIVGRITNIVVGPDAEQLHSWLDCILPAVRVDQGVVGLSSVSVEIDGCERIVPLE